MNPEGLHLLNWALIAISFFNTIVLLWLGLTVLLNADHRALRTWTAGGGLVLCGLFFAGHSAVVSHTPGTIGPHINFWWRISWLPLIGAPYLWYVVMASYAGVLKSAIHTIALTLITAVGLIALVLLVVAEPLPSFGQVVERVPLGFLSVAGIPVVALVYPLYSMLCVTLALLALWRPEMSERFMGDLARLRARPWLVTASIVLFTLCIVFAGAVGWFLREVQTQPPALYFLQSLGVLMGFDLAICFLVGLAIMLTGQAIVAYEIFTGKALPRGGLRRYWHRCLVFAAGYGAVMGASFSIALDPSYRLLLATTLMTLFFALVSWRSYSDHERSMHHLQPFIRSQRLYDHLVHPVTPTDVDVALPFRALCANVLEARVAYLAALGPLAPLVGPALIYPEGRTAPTLSFRELVTQMGSSQVICTRIDPSLYGGAVWAVPLWSERGLIGVLLLGEKLGGGLYTQEDIEIARTTGERLIDTRASTEMALRLMTLQRRRIQESLVIDRRARHVLHDDVLPRLHTAMLILSSQPAHRNAIDGANHADAVGMLTDVHRYVATLLHDMPAASELEASRLGMLGTIRHALEGELQHAFDAVRWEVDPEAEQIANLLPPLSVEVLAYAAREAIRNAARHGRGAFRERILALHVQVRRHNGLEVMIEDNGVGIVAGERTTGGNGHGLALHTTMMAVVGGTLTVESERDCYTRVVLVLPQDVYQEALSHVTV